MSSWRINSSVAEDFSPVLHADLRLLTDGLLLGCDDSCERKLIDDNLVILLMYFLHTLLIYPETVSDT